MISFSAPIGVSKQYSSVVEKAGSDVSLTLNSGSAT